MGVGTVAIAALKNKRKVLGSEKNPKYVKIGIKRLKKLAANKLETRPMNKPIYTETK